MVQAGRELADLPDIGKDLAQMIVEICTTGRLAALAETEARMPQALVALSAVPELGPKRLRELREARGVTSVDGLVQACAAGQVAKLPSFNPALEARLLRAASRRN